MALTTMLPEPNISIIIDCIIYREGGHSNDAADSGGDTYFGITRPFADEFGIPWPPTREDAAAGYRRALAQWRIDQIPDADTLDLVADCCINHGAARGVKWLQEALGVNSDGVIGPVTIATMSQRIGATIWRNIRIDIATHRILHYGAIVHNDPTQAKFINGWLKRAVSFL